MFMSILMFGEPGVEIMYPDPGFPIYRSMISTPAQAGARADPRRRLFISAEETLKDHAAHAALILNSPAKHRRRDPEAEADKLVAGLEKWPDVAVMSDDLRPHGL
jgi:hypothetical protein